MSEFLEIPEEWMGKSGPIAMIRVLKTWGSSPRPIGSLMFVDHQGKILGSVSGGCVEGAVVKKALENRDARKATVLQFGIADEDAWSVGLSCGGKLHTFMQYIDLQEDSIWQKLYQSIRNNKASILISTIEDGQNKNSLMDENGNISGDDLPDEVKIVAQEAFNQRSHKITKYESTEYFIQLFPAKYRLIIIGAAHITADLVQMGNYFGFETIVIDPRGFFAKNTVFKDPPSKIIENYPSEVLTEYPLDAYTFSAVLSHDSKIDDDALEILLPSNAGYIGVLGSRKNHEKRVQRLRDKGIDENLIEKIKAPIGIDINSKSAREIALSIMGEIIKVKNEYR